MLVLEPIQHGETDHLARHYIKGLAQDGVQSDEVAGGDDVLVLGQDLVRAVAMILSRLCFAACLQAGCNTQCVMKEQYNKTKVFIMSLPGYSKFRQARTKHDCCTTATDPLRRFDGLGVAPNVGGPEFLPV
jgi:hypothetical protein